MTLKQIFKINQNYLEPLKKTYAKAVYKILARYRLSEKEETLLYYEACEIAGAICLERMRTRIMEKARQRNKGES